MYRAVATRGAVPGQALVFGELVFVAPMFTLFCACSATFPQHVNSFLLCFYLGSDPQLFRDSEGTALRTTAPGCSQHAECEYQRQLGC